MTSTTGSVDLPFPSRRAVLLSAAGASVALVGAPGTAAVAVPTGADRARYLSAERLETLRAVVDRVVPADDGAPGAVEAGCHEAIDALLGAFTTDPPRIYAGGPFSDRGGSRVNHFAEFLPLDRYEATAWRLRIRGSRGRRRLERNGAFAGWQRIYRRGLDALAETVPGFASLPGPVRDAALRAASDPRVTAMTDLAVAHTLETYFGAPEYGGNRDGIGWDVIGFDGDRQPRGYTDAEVSDPEREPLPVLELGTIVARYGPALALATSESMLGPLTAGVRGHAEVSERIAAWTGSYDEALAALRRGGAR